MRRRSSLMNNWYIHIPSCLAYRLYVCGFYGFGPRQRPDLAIHKFIRLIENNERIPLYGNGKTKRDYTYIGDIVDGVEAALAYSRRSYDIFNLGGGSPVTLIQMVRTIEKVLGKRHQ